MAEKHLFFPSTFSHGLRRRCHAGRGHVTEAPQAWRDEASHDLFIFSTFDVISYVECHHFNLSYDYTHQLDLHTQN